MTNWCS